MIPANNDPTMLLAAATGRMPQPRVSNAPKAAAMRNVVGGAGATATIPPPSPITGVGPSMPSNITEFRDISGLSFPMNPIQGLSEKGKYGGFTTQDQLNQAIYGEAVGQQAGALGYAADVRDFASKRLADINKALTQAQRQYGPTTEKRTLSPVGMPTQNIEDMPTTMFSPMGQKYTQQELSDYREAMRQYAEKASVMPQQQLGMAQDISQTPLYQYARAIATNRYGMNPYQAVGEFGPSLDTRAFEERRNLQSMMETGMPYDIALEEQARQNTEAERAYQQSQRAETALDQDVIDYIESGTGLSQNRLRQLTGMSNAMVFESIMNDPVTPGATPEQKMANFRAQSFGLISSFIEGDDQQKQTIISALNQLMSDPERPGVGQILWANLRQYMTQQGAGQKALSQALLDQLSPIINPADYSQYGQ